jgi:mRNA interferase RelE/StbE
LAWTIEWDERAVKDAEKLGHEARRRILAYLRERVATDANPRRLGKPLAADKTGLWRYRVGDYRIVCRIEDDGAVVLILAVGHRSTAYR